MTRKRKYNQNLMTRGQTYPKMNMPFAQNSAYPASYVGNNTGAGTFANPAGSSSQSQFALSSAINQWPKGPTGTTQNSFPAANSSSAYQLSNSPTYRSPAPFVENLWNAMGVWGGGANFSQATPSAVTLQGQNWTGNTGNSSGATLQGQNWTGNSSGQNWTGNASGATRQGQNWTGKSSGGTLTEKNWTGNSWNATESSNRSNTKSDNLRDTRFMGYDDSYRQGGRDEKQSPRRRKEAFMRREDLDEDSSFRDYDREYRESGRRSRDRDEQFLGSKEGQFARGSSRERIRGRNSGGQRHDSLPRDRSSRRRSAERRQRGRHSSDRNSPKSSDWSSRANAGNEWMQQSYNQQTKSSPGRKNKDSTSQWPAQNQTNQAFASTLAAAAQSIASNPVAVMQQLQAMQANLPFASVASTPSATLMMTNSQSMQLQERTQLLQLQQERSAQALQLQEQARLLQLQARSRALQLQEEQHARAVQMLQQQSRAMQLQNNSRAVGMQKMPRGRAQFWAKRFASAQNTANALVTGTKRRIGHQRQSWQNLKRLSLKPLTTGGPAIKKQWSEVKPKPEQHPGTRKHPVHRSVSTWCHVDNNGTASLYFSGRLWPMRQVVGERNRPTAALFLKRTLPDLPQSWYKSSPSSKASTVVHVPFNELHPAPDNSMKDKARSSGDATVPAVGGSKSEKAPSSRDSKTDKAKPKGGIAISPCSLKQQLSDTSPCLVGTAPTALPGLAISESKPKVKPTDSATIPPRTGATNPETCSANLKSKQMTDTQASGKLDPNLATQSKSPGSQTAGKVKPSATINPKLQAKVTKKINSSKTQVAPASVAKAAPASVSQIKDSGKPSEFKVPSASASPSYGSTQQQVKLPNVENASKVQSKSAPTTQSKSSSPKPLSQTANSDKPLETKHSSAPVGSSASTQQPKEKKNISKTQSQPVPSKLTCSNTEMASLSPTSDGKPSEVNVSTTESNKQMQETTNKKSPQRTETKPAPQKPSQPEKSKPISVPTQTKTRSAPAKSKSPAPELAKSRPLRQNSQPEEEELTIISPLDGSDETYSPPLNSDITSSSQGSVVMKKSAPKTQPGKPPSTDLPSTRSHLTTENKSSSILAAEESIIDMSSTTAPESSDADKPHPSATQAPTGRPGDAEPQSVATLQEPPAGPLGLDVIIPSSQSQPMQSVTSTLTAQPPRNKARLAKSGGPRFSQPHPKSVLGRRLSYIGYFHSQSSYVQYRSARNQPRNSKLELLQVDPVITPSDEMVQPLLDTCTPSPAVSVSLTSTIDTASPSLSASSPAETRLTRRAARSGRP